MRQFARAALLFLAVALPALAGGINLLTSTRAEFTDCASGGSVAQTLTAGQYLMRVTDADTFLCFAASGSTCASGGEKFPVGTVVLLTLTTGQVSVSCRSSASTGDVIFTAAN